MIHSTESRIGRSLHGHFTKAVNKGPLTIIRLPPQHRPVVWFVYNTPT